MSDTELAKSAGEALAELMLDIDPARLADPSALGEALQRSFEINDEDEIASHSSRM